VGYTGPHDEIGHARALNYMLRCSLGALLWFGFFVNEVLEKWGKDTIDDEFVQEIFEQPDPVALLQFLLKKGVTVWVAEQLPGRVVVSSAANGSVHSVLGAGCPALNIAWNDRMKLDGLRR
jgi:hypothetical protein